jgi:hypothetical protein
MSDIWSGPLKYTGVGIAMNLVNGKGLFPKGDDDDKEPKQSSNSSSRQHDEDDDSDEDVSEPEKRALDETGEEEPHYMEAREDCMGNPTSGYWRQFLTTNDKYCVIGSGDTKEEAHKNALAKRDEYNRNLEKSPQEQIRRILAKYENNDILSGDMSRIIKLLAKIVVKNDRQ